MGHVMFTNLKCVTHNKTIVEFQSCEIKAFNRTHKYINIHAKNINGKNVTNAIVNMKLLRFNNGYKPFLVNVTFDVCKFLKNQNHPIVNLIFKPIKSYTNLNHSCPYNDDIIVDKFWTGNHDVEFLKYLPIPNGDYILAITLYVNNTELISTYTYVRLTS
ncbi:uncharacterized protein LOC127565417 [Drosophila albomicans]|uniref:Uncharacterized protein LOC127565417 n=1 Tax=Drosophila albomicans TaxID=7291 RepID=A0A9C6T158_DROAB|nr:uncharacterized protein LOC127565417 [Drosophila albomicans]